MKTSMELTASGTGNDFVSRLLLHDRDSMKWIIDENDDSTSSVSNLLRFSSVTTNTGPMTTVSSNANASIQSQIRNSFDHMQLEKLIHAAECYESNDLVMAEFILSQLDQNLRSPTGRAVERIAFYFKEALKSLLVGSNHSITTYLLSPIEKLHKIKALTIFSEISPIPYFASYTANEAILQSLHGSHFIHLIDFEIGTGDHWVTFLDDLNFRSANSQAQTPTVRITAILLEETLEKTVLTGMLQNQARKFSMNLSIEFVNMRAFECISFRSIRFFEKETVAICLSPKILRNLGSSNAIYGFLNHLRLIKPSIIVFLDDECQSDSRFLPFTQNFIAGLEFYSSLLESLDFSRTHFTSTSEKRSIEVYLIQSMIAEHVKYSASGSKMKPWPEVLAGAGLVQVRLGGFAEMSAKRVVEMTSDERFNVETSNSFVLLCWHGKPLFSTSAWKL